MGCGIVKRTVLNDIDQVLSWIFTSATSMDEAEIIVKYLNQSFFG